jgi:DNA-directed RNA polymerase subunit M/transcription elongation factor TFIIS
MSEQEISCNMLLKKVQDTFVFTIPFSLYENKEYNSLRRSYLVLLSSILDKLLTKFNIPYKSYRLKDEIIQIELSCYNHTLEEAEYYSVIKDWNCPMFELLYRCKITRITKNLDYLSEVQDTHLFFLILNKKVDLDRISYLKSEELSPKSSEIIIKNLKERKEQKLSYKTTSLYKCPKCKKNECMIRMVQLRSLDEGENISLRCIYCHHAWVI